MQIRGIFFISVILVKKKYSCPIDNVTVTQSQFISFIKVKHTPLSSELPFNTHKMQTQLFLEIQVLLPTNKDSLKVFECLSNHVLVLIKQRVIIVYKGHLLYITS